MTSTYINLIKAKTKKSVRGSAFIFFTLLLVMLACFESKDIKVYAINGLRLCYMNIIPTLFPFVVLSDILIGIADAGKIQKSVFPFVMMIGGLCGFPVGAICVKKLYDSCAVNKKEAEILISVSSVPSVAFVVSGIGGMLGNTRYGFILWISVMISSVLTYLLFAEKQQKPLFMAQNTKQNIDLSRSIKNAGYVMMNVSSFIVFFSVVIGMATAFIKSELLVSIISAVLEVGNAGFMISTLDSITINFKLILLGFSLSFSGVSVLMQVKSSVEGYDISLKKYLFYKMIEGGICIIFISLFLILFNLFDIQF